MAIEVDKNISNAYIDLSFGPTWPYVRVVREFIESFCRVSFGEHDHYISERISSSASELVENAVKYSIHDTLKNGTRVKVELVQQKEVVILEVQNHALQNHLDVLQQHIVQLSKMGETELQNIYRQKMLQAAEDGTTSQLGLIRILWEWRAEALQMDIFNSEEAGPLNKKVIVRAIFRLGSSANE